MTTSSDLAPSPTWARMAAEIARDCAIPGAHFSDGLTMNVAIRQHTLEPYAAHRKRLDELLWRDDASPKRIIEVGAGYGAMASFWPSGSTVYNVDLPEMLDVQRGYVGGLDAQRPDISFVPISEADSIDPTGAYLFSVWALTETTRAAWEYWIERAPKLAGAYVLGFRQWVDEPQPWPWDRLLRAFTSVRAFDVVAPDSWELAAVNR